MNKILTGLISHLLHCTILVFASHYAHAYSDFEHVSLPESTSTASGLTLGDSTAGWIFVEDFTDNRNAWIIDNPNTMIRCELILGSVLKMTNNNSSSGSITKIIPNLNAAHSIRIETEVSINSECEAGLGNGLLFGADEELKNYFAFIVNNNGAYKIAQYRNGTFSTLKDWTESIRIKQSGGNNKLTIINHNKKWDFYINGFPVHSMEMQTFAGNRVGFIIAPNCLLYSNSLMIYDWEEAFGKTSFKEPIYESIIWDNFTNNKNGWEESDGKYARLKLLINEYMIENKTPGSYSSTQNFSRQDVYPSYIKSVMRQGKGPDDAPYGICFGMKDPDNLYLFGVSSNGWYIISEFNNGNLRTIKEWTQSPAVKTGYNNYNELIFENENGKWVFKVNGQVVYECRDLGFHGYKSGMYVENVSTAYFIHFSLIKKIYPL